MKHILQVFSNVFKMYLEKSMNNRIYMLVYLILCIDFCDFNISLFYLDFEHNLFSLYYQIRRYS